MVVERCSTMLPSRHNNYKHSVACGNVVNVLVLAQDGGGSTCVHESLQVQCIDVLMSLQSRDNVQAKCTELVVIRVRMSDLL